MSEKKHSVLVINSLSCSLRRVYVINKEICVKTVCREEELLKGGTTNNCFIMNGKGTIVFLNAVILTFMSVINIL